tara:strand:+ start:6821 stop:6940 length:120 start_codon:yes stop_codon:yes gene_type:complete
VLQKIIFSVLEHDEAQKAIRLYDIDELAYQINLTNDNVF